MSVALSFSWDPDSFAGVGRAEQAICTVPHCGREVNSRGLCISCYKAWRRDGIDGLRKRAQNVLTGFRQFVPLDLKQAMTRLVDVYEEWTDTDDKETYAALEKKIIRICAAIGTLERRKRWARYTRTWREKKGLQAPGARGRGQKALPLVAGGAR